MVEHSETVVSEQVVVHIVKDAVCAACDPNSQIPHVVQVTRFRVTNLCCAGEEKIIRAVLQDFVGIESVAVNVIGRYAVVKHCTVVCCSPSEKIVEALNLKHLGVSIQEAAGSDEEEVEEMDVARIAHVVTVGLLFAIGLVFSFINSLKTASDGVYLASIALGILPILHASYVTIVRQTIDIHILILIAIVGAVAAGEYFDGSLVVTLFIASELVESIVMQRVREAVKTSTGKLNKGAFLLSGKTVKVEDLKCGDLLAVRAGEMVLGDGVIVKGEGVLDESALTGESVPIAKRVGDKVLSGTVVQNGYMEVELTVDYLNCTMTKLNQEVADVQADRGEYARIVDVFSVYWTPLVIFATLVLVLVGGGVTGDWRKYVYQGLILLILACPCPIVIAAPIPSVCCIGAAAKHGILIRGSSVIERLGKVDTIALDKTGTLTKGFFKVGERLLLSEPNEQQGGYDVMQLAAAIEQKSTHPLANAVVAEYCGCIADMDENDLQMPRVRKIAVQDGVGVSGWVEVEGDWKYVAVGNERLLKANGGKVVLSDRQSELYKDFLLRSGGYVQLIVVVDNAIEMVLSLSDEVRSESVGFVERVQRMGMDVSMLTGDQEQVARNICSTVGIPSDQCFFRLMPSEKLAWIQKAQEQQAGKTICGFERAGKNVLMVGDGINDSVALTAASVGVAMGAGGSAMAVASADVILMTDNLMLIPDAIALCKLARVIMMQNFSFAIAVKIVAIILALMGRLQFWEAILVDVGTLFVVVANGTRPLSAGKKFNQLKSIVGGEKDVKMKK
eukprot:gene26033-32560_t